MTDPKPNDYSPDDGVATVYDDEGRDFIEIVANNDIELWHLILNSEDAQASCAFFFTQGELERLHEAIGKVLGVTP